MTIVKFTQLKDGTRDDYLRLKAIARPDPGPTEAIIVLFESLASIAADGWPITVYQHTLQSGTMALRDGADEELVVCAALHDLGQEIATYEHGDFIADILAPYISGENEWILRHHPDFQKQFLDGYFDDPHAHEVYRGHPLFERTLAFVERWDQAAFDPNYDTMPLEALTPIMRRVLSTPRADRPARARQRRSSSP